MSRTSHTKVVEKSKHCGQYSACITSALVTSMKCSTRRRKSRENYTNTVSARSGQMLILLPNGRKPAMRNSAASNAFNRRTTITEVLASVEFQRDPSMKAKLFNAKHVDAEDVHLAIDFFPTFLQQTTTSLRRKSHNHCISFLPIVWSSPTKFLLKSSWFLSCLHLNKVMILN